MTLKATLTHEELKALRGDLFELKRAKAEFETADRKVLLRMFKYAEKYGVHEENWDINPSTGAVIVTEEPPVDKPPMGAQAGG